MCRAQQVLDLSTLTPLVTNVFFWVALTAHFADFDAPHPRLPARDQEQAERHDADGFAGAGGARRADGLSLCIVAWCYAGAFQAVLRTITMCPYIAPQLIMFSHWELQSADTKRCTPFVTHVFPLHAESDAFLWRLYIMHGILYPTVLWAVFPKVCPLCSSKWCRHFGFACAHSRLVFPSHSH